MILSQRIIVSRNVVFEENEEWEWEKQHESTNICELEWEDDENVVSKESPIEEDVVDAQPEESLVTNQETSEGLVEGRSRKKPAWLRDYVSEAVKIEKWRNVMDAKIVAIEKNGTWELIDRPTGAKLVGVKWVYKTKLNEKREVDKVKARLVVKGYAQQYGVDYIEVFAPVARMETVRLKGNEEKVYKLKKALYGLKQAPRAWYSCTEAYFVKEGNDESMFTKFKNLMMLEFDMTDIGKMKYFLGLEVLHKSEFPNSPNPREKMSLIPNFFGGRRSNVFDPFSLDVWDPFKDFPFPNTLSSASFPEFSRENSAFVSTRVDWKETPEAHVFKADIPGLKKEEVKVQIEDDKVLQISGERNVEKEDRNNTWHRVERSSGKFMRRFRLPENAKVDKVKASMENGVLTVTVPKEEVKKADVKNIQISG
ncbi:18.5 kDa class I heat shock protein [Glycine soja]|nr:18.5 kDa class I heat shock protein [Glycine soja]